MPKATFIESAICIFSIYALSDRSVSSNLIGSLSQTLYSLHCRVVTGKLKQNNSADVKAVFYQSSRLGTYENKKRPLSVGVFEGKKTSVFKTAFSDLL